MTQGAESIGLTAALAGFAASTGAAHADAGRDPVAPFLHSTTVEPRPDVTASDVRNHHTHTSAPAPTLPQAVLEAATLLLGADDGSAFDVAVADALAHVGRASGMHRATLIEYVDDEGGPGDVWWQVAAEWHAPDVMSQGASPHVRGRLSDSADWTAQVAGCDVAVAVRTEELRDVALRDVQHAVGARYLLSAPIRLDGRVWGCLSFDDCRTDRRRTHEEMALLAAAAQTVGLAVQRHQTRLRVTAAERAHLVAIADERARGAVAMAEARATALDRANTLLSAVAHAAEMLTRTPDLSAGFVAAGRVLGEATGVDRVNLFRYDHAVAAGFLHAEWSRTGVPPVSTIDPGPYSYADYEEVWRVLMAGDVYHSPLTAKTGSNAELNAAASTKTDMHVPIMVDGRFWGGLNFDDCTTERSWADGEVDVLRAAAEAVAAAVRREELEAGTREVVARERAQAAAERVAALGDANAALANRLRLVDAAVQTADLLLASTDVGTAMPDVLARLGPTLGADRAILGRFDPPDADSHQGWLEVTHEWVATGLARQMDDPALVRLNIDHYGDIYERLQAGRIVQARTADLPDAARDEQTATGAVSQIVITVLVRGQLWGFLGFDDCRTDRIWDEAEVGLLQIVASSIGGALERESAERAVVIERQQAAEQRAAELAAANDMLQGTVASLAAGRGVDAFRTSVLQEAARQSDAAATALVLLDDAADTLRLAAAFADGQDALPGRDAWLAPLLVPVRASDDPAWQVLRASQDPLFVHAVDDPQFGWPATRTMHRTRGHLTLGYVRLQVGNRPLGFLGLAWRTADVALTPVRCSVLTVLAQQLALALELDRLAMTARLEAEQSAVLEERTRLARELHDTVAQGLAGLVMQLGRVRTKLGAAANAAEEEFAMVDRLVRDSLGEARRALATLRPVALEANDLATAVRVAVSTAEAAPGEHARIALDVSGQPRSLPAEVELELFRTTQAALANACQHAAATTIEVELAFEVNGAVCAVVRDDGRGFDPAVPRPGRFGLAGMSERAARIEATLAVVTAPGEGTEVVIRWVPPAAPPAPALPASRRRAVDGGPAS